MIRVLVPVPSQYRQQQFEQLVAGIRVDYPSCVAVNEVENSNGRFVACYFEAASESVPATEDLSVAIARIITNIPTGAPVANVSVEQRISDLEEALAMLHMQLAEVNARVVGRTAEGV